MLVVLAPHAPGHGGEHETHAQERGHADLRSIADLVGGGEPVGKPIGFGQARWIGYHVGRKLGQQIVREAAAGGGVEPANGAFPSGPAFQPSPLGVMMRG